MDNGSTDNSAKVIAAELARYGDAPFKSHHVPVNLGYGWGILSGLQTASGRCLAWTHADMQTDPSDVFLAFDVYQRECVSHGEVMVKGRRVGRSFASRCFTAGMSFFASVLLGAVLHDINAQPKLFSRELFLSFENPPQDFSLDLFLLYIGKCRKIPLKTIDVDFKNRVHGESKWAFGVRSRMRTIMRTITYMLALRQRVRQT